MVPVVPLFSTEHSKGKILALSQELRSENNVMDKIWYKNPSKSVIGRCGGDKKNEWPRYEDTMKTAIVFILMELHSIWEERKKHPKRLTK